MDSPNLRESIRQLMEGVWHSRSLDDVLPEIMSAIDAAWEIPPEKDNELNLGTYYKSDVGQIEKDAIAAIYEVVGYNQALDEMQAIKQRALMDQKHQHNA